MNLVADSEKKGRGQFPMVTMRQSPTIYLQPIHATDGSQYDDDNNNVS